MPCRCCARAGLGSTRDETGLETPVAVGDEKWQRREWVFKGCSSAAGRCRGVCNGRGGGGLSNGSEAGTGPTPPGRPAGHTARPLKEDPHLPPGRRAAAGRGLGTRVAGARRGEPGFARSAGVGREGRPGALPEQSSAPAFAAGRDPPLVPHRAARRGEPCPVSGALLPRFPSAGPAGRGLRGSAAAGVSHMAPTWGRGAPRPLIRARRVAPVCGWGALTPRLREGLRRVIFRARRLGRGGRPSAFLLPFKVRRGGDAAGFSPLTLVAVPPALGCRGQGGSGGDWRGLAPADRGRRGETQREGERCVGPWLLVLG